MYNVLWINKWRNWQLTNERKGVQEMREAYIIYNVVGIYVGHQLSQVVKGQVSTRTWTQGLWRTVSPCQLSTHWATETRYFDSLFITCDINNPNKENIWIYLNKYKWIRNKLYLYVYILILFIHLYCIYFHFSFLIISIC